MLSSPPPMRIWFASSANILHLLPGSTWRLRVNPNTSPVLPLITSPHLLPRKIQGCLEPHLKKGIIKHPSKWCYEIAGWIHCWEKGADVWGLVLQPPLRNSDFSSNVNWGLVAKPKGFMFCVLAKKFWNTINSKAGPCCLITIYNGLSFLKYQQTIRWFLQREPLNSTSASASENKKSLFCHCRWWNFGQNY